MYKIQGFLESVDGNLGIRKTIFESVERRYHEIKYNYRKQLVEKVYK